jgi:hypothetical protein
VGEKQFFQVGPFWYQTLGARGQRNRSAAKLRNHVIVENSSGCGLVPGQHKYVNLVKQVSFSQSSAWQCLLIALKSQ